MPGGLYQRVANRGFHSAVADGLTGAGALDAQGNPLPPQDLTDSNPAQYSTLPGFDPTPVADLSLPLLEGIWGMPGSGWNPDQTPRTHAAPFPGWAGSQDDPELLTVHENSVAIHSVDFGALEPRITSPNGLAQPHIDQWRANEPGENVLEPVSGQLQYMGGRDDAQGYSLRNRYGFDAGHRDRITLSNPVVNSYLDPSERPFVVPQVTGSFRPTDAVQGPNPTADFRDAGNLNSTEPTSYVPPSDPVGQLAAAPGGAGPVGAAGWWG
jgi:hypothetical protein